MRNFFFTILLSLGLVSCNSTPTRTEAESNLITASITVNPRSATDMFEGIGAVSAGASSRLLIDYPEPYRSQILDYLFLPKFGAGFQHLKVEIGGDINSTDGTEPSHLRKKGEENYDRGYEWWLMKEAQKRNPDIILDGLAWGAPGWLGKNEFYTREGAEYFVSFIKGAKKAHNLDIKYIGIWNEREFSPDWIKLYRKTLDENGLENVGIVAADLNGPPQRLWSIADSMIIDKELEDAIDVIGIHYPYGAMSENALQLKKRGKRLWSSEDGEWNWMTMTPVSNQRARKINMNYIGYRLTKTEFWSPVTSYYDCLPAPQSGVITANTPWSGAYVIEGKLWDIAHTTQFVQPGWYYLIEACRTLPAGGSVVAYTSPDYKEVSIIIETIEATAEQTLAITPGGDFKQQKMYLWHSNPLEHFVQGDDIKIKDGAFTIKLEPNCVYSITTTTGQKKGIYSSPMPSSFPLPYNENFNSYLPAAVPKYLSDQGGAFEVEELRGGEKILRQQLDQRGIDWSASTFASAIIGDVNWNDVEVTSDVQFPEMQDTSMFVQISARCYNGSTWHAFGKPYPVGYTFRWHADGRWEIAVPLRILASGTVLRADSSWHKMSIKCKGAVISTFVDGKIVKEISDNTYQRGLVGIGCSFHKVGFDNLRITESGK